MFRRNTSGAEHRAPSSSVAATKMMTLLLSLCMTMSYVIAFPQGAPPETCESLSPERGHETKSQVRIHVVYYDVQQSLL